MKSSKAVVFEISGVGEVTFKRSRRARRLNIRIKPFAGVSVSVPVGMSLADSEHFVNRQRLWIARHLGRIREIEKRSIVYDGAKEVCTRWHKLDVRAVDSAGIHIMLMDGRILVRYSRKLHLRDPRVQSAIGRGLVAAYRLEAKRYLPQRLKCLAGRHGFFYQRVVIKNLKSRWGSCSSKNNINLNLHLMRLPDDLIDYVLLHELAHTRIKNHSPEFWELLEAHYPDARAADKRLRKIESELTAL